MKYILLTHLDEHAWERLGEAEQQRLIRDGVQYCQQLKVAGKYLQCDPLHPVSSATSVRVRGGQRLVTDGPYAETHEQLGGYTLIDVDTLNEAIDVAARLIGGGPATIEIRRVMELAGLPRVRNPR